MLVIEAQDLKFILTRFLTDFAICLDTGMLDFVDLHEASNSKI